MKQQQWQTRAAIATLAFCFATGTAHATAMTDTPATAGSTSAAALDTPRMPVEDGAQANDHLFDGVDKLGAKAKESNEVNLDKNTLNLAARKGGDKAELAKKLDFVEIRNYAFANEGEYNLADVLAITKKLEGDGWKHLVRNRDGKQLNDIAVKQDSEGVTREMVILNAGPKELNLVHVRGNVSVSDLHHMGGLMGSTMRDDDAGSAAAPRMQKH